jgi:PAS domain S-box-containing protein
MDKTLSGLKDGTMELLVAAISDYAIYMLNPAGNIVSWNAGAERFKGYTADEIIGDHFSKFHTPEDQAAGIPAMALRIAKEEGKFECEGWRVRKDGKRFWASVVIDPVYAGDGTFVGYAKITRDMTEKKRASDELFASEQQFRLLVQGVLDYAIYLISPEGVITNWNNGARRIKGYEAAEIIGCHFSAFYTQEDRQNGMPGRALAEAKVNGRYEAEAWRVRKDGTKFWAHVVIDAIRDDSGALLGFAKITRDITEKKEAERALEQTRAELFQSQKMESIGQLTGGVAHDFNNLLSIISSAVQILASQSPSTLERRVIDSIHRAVDRGSALTQQLLAFARQQPLEPANREINKVIQGFESVLRRAVTSSIEFRTRLASEVRWVHLDDTRFEAALLNLVVNARDAMPDGGVLELSTSDVTISAGEHANLPPGKYVRITVADTGTGMSAEVVSKAFEPFYTTKEVGKGTGLGLSQVQGFIVQSGGGVTIDSASGCGTRIHLMLPTVELTEEAKEITSSREIVLIAEDEQELSALASSLFQTLGYEVLIAHTGSAALRILEENPGIDLLFADVVMPGMTGIELARTAQAAYPDMKIILASGYPIPALRADDDINEFSFVSKPYRLSEIVKKLR